MDDVAISVQHINKTFKLPHEKHSSLKSTLINFRRRGFEKQHALDDISFEVKKGEFFGIVGRNGSGKSTLLKLLAGIYTPDSGRIQVNGKLTPFIELGVGFNPELSGRDNVFLNGALLGFSRREMAAMYDEIVAFAELERFMDQKLKNYSSGMQVRLAFSIAIRANTDILVLDEVLAVGDANFQKKCFEYFGQLKKDKKTVILVSHDMDSVKSFSDRALLLDNSKVVMVGDPDKVSDRYIQMNTERSVPQNTEQMEDTPANQTEKLVTVTATTALNKKGNAVQTLMSGDPLTVAVDYTVAQGLPKLQVGIGIHAEAGGYVLGYNTEMDSFAVDKDAGEHKLLLLLGDMPLTAGKYYANVVCFGDDETVPYDLQSKVLSFTVETKKTAGAYRGLLNLDHSWNKK